MWMPNSPGPCENYSTHCPHSFSNSAQSYNQYRIPLNAYRTHSCMGLRFSILLSYHAQFHCNLTPPNPTVPSPSLPPYSLGHGSTAEQLDRERVPPSLLRIVPPARHLALVSRHDFRRHTIVRDTVGQILILFGKRAFKNTSSHYTLD